MYSLLGSLYRCPACDCIFQHNRWANYIFFPIMQSFHDCLGRLKNSFSCHIKESPNFLFFLHLFSSVFRPILTLLLFGAIFGVAMANPKVIYPTIFSVAIFQSIKRGFMYSQWKSIIHICLTVWFTLCSGFTKCDNLTELSLTKSHL